MSTTLERPNSVPVGDRRARGRSVQENTATGLIETIMTKPQEAAAALVRDVEAGADPEVVLALLDAVQSVARLRGLKIDPFVGAMRNRISLPDAPGQLAGAGAQGARSSGGRQSPVPRWLGWLP
ncbi:MAG: hypothetical protein HY560_09880 [Gemmatimonadetes bacterium]|nr:hypothetical protein [Gemmatimonadota bacterium]